MTMMEAIFKLNNLVDESDPDVSVMNHTLLWVYCTSNFYNSSIVSLVCGHSLLVITLLTPISCLPVVYLT